MQVFQIEVTSPIEYAGQTIRSELIAGLLTDYFKKITGHDVVISVAEIRDVRLAPIITDKPKIRIPKLMAQCIYCGKVHDLRVACKAYIDRNTGWNLNKYEEKPVAYRILTLCVLTSSAILAAGLLAAWVPHLFEWIRILFGPTAFGP